MPLDDIPEKGSENPPEPEFPPGDKKSDQEVDKPDVDEAKVDDDNKTENAVNEALEVSRNNRNDLQTTTTPRADANGTDPQVIVPPEKDVEKDESEEIESKENGSPDKNEDQSQTMDEETKRKIIIGVSIAGATILGAAVAPFALVGALGAAGFGTGGVAVGSIAAAIQSSVYGGAVASGSAFAICQSIGAAGLGAAGTAASAIGGGGIFAGTAALFSSLFTGKKGGSTAAIEAKDANEKSPDEPKCDKKTQTSALGDENIDTDKKDENFDASCSEITPTEEKKPL